MPFYQFLFAFLLLLNTKPNFFTRFFLEQTEFIRISNNIKKETQTFMTMPLDSETHEAITNVTFIVMDLLELFSEQLRKMVKVHASLLQTGHPLFKRNGEFGRDAEQLQINSEQSLLQLALFLMSDESIKTVFNVDVIKMREEWEELDLVRKMKKCLIRVKFLKAQLIWGVHNV